MRRLTAASAVVVLRLTTAASYAAGATPRGSLVLVGTRSASMTVVLRSAVTVTDPFRLDAEFRGSYAGYLLSDAHGRVLLGGVAVRGVGMPAGEGLPLGFTPTPLRPGRYVVTLIADGPAKVVIPLAGGSVVARPERPARVFARVLHDDALPGTPAGSPLAYSATPVPAGHHQLATLASFFTGSADEAGQADECFTTARLCQLGGDGGSFSYLSPGVGSTDSYSGMGMAPADFVSGTSAVLDSADLAVQARHAGFVLVLG